MKDDSAPRTSPPAPGPTVQGRGGGLAQRLLSPRSRGWLLGLLLVVGTILAYQPVWRAGFIWDDDVYVTQNKLLVAPDGLRRIWFSKDSPSQYFPMVYTTFRLEHALWELNPAGYHWVNLLLHTANALLVWRLLRRLRLPGAWLGAALFALHPVQVETVAWVTERKNVLSLFFYLLSLRAWLEFVEDRPRLRWRFYALALVLFALALLSKTTACTLPVALLLVFWLQRKPISWSRLAQAVPFLVLGLCMGLLTMWWERYHIGTSGGVFVIGFLERLLIATRGVWFYLGKLLWPVNLTFSYPRWVIDPAAPLAYAWLLAGLAVCGVIAFARRFLGRGPEVAALFFVATLGPTSGFIMLFTFRYTFVADHYQYVACLGPLALAAAGLTWAFDSLRGRLPWLGPALGAALLLGLGALTWHQAGAYRDIETLWRDTLAKNPGSRMAHCNLGRCLMHQGRLPEAMEQYRLALELDPNDVDSLVSVGNALFGQGRPEEAADYYRRALRTNPNNPEAHVNLAVILANQGRTDEAIAHDRQAIVVNPKHVTAHVNLAVALVSKGQYQEAIEHYRQALEVNPDQPLTHVNLAIALTAMGRSAEADEHYRKAATVVNGYANALAQQGRLAEAEAQYREAIRLIPNNPEAHCGLGILLARQGRRDEAREQLAEALRLRPDYPEAQRQLRALTQPEAGAGQNR